MNVFFNRLGWLMKKTVVGKEKVPAFCFLGVWSDFFERRAFYESDVGLKSFFFVWEDYCNSI